MKLLLGFAALATTAAAPGGPQDAVDRVSLLVARGMAAERANDGRAMLAAARGLEALGARPADREGDIAAHWRKRAKALGIRDKEPPVRGRALGPAYRRGVLSAGQGLSTQQVFLAGQKAEVALVPEPGRTLTIRIAGRDQQICERTATAPKAACSWLPVFTHRVEIRVSNQGAQPASYYLVSN
jgi:hypothetical protein